MKYSIVPLIAAALCMSACGGGDDPKKVATDFWQATMDGDFETAKSLVTEESRKKMEDPGGRKKSSDVDEFTVEEATIEGDSATCKTQLKSNGSHLNITTQLAREDGEWRVDMAASMRSFGEAFTDNLKNAFKDIQGEMMDATSGLPDEVIEAMKKSINGGG